MVFKVMAVAILILIMNCKQNKEAEIIPVDLVDSQGQNDTKQANKLSYATASFTIKGMSCEMGCARAIENKLSSLDGISKASINFKEQMATVKFDANKIDEPLLISTVTSLSQTSSYSVEDFKMILETSKN